MQVFPFYFLSTMFKNESISDLSFFFLFRVFPSTSDLDLEKFVAPLFAPLEGKN